MSRNYNFCAGPAALPNEVLDQLKAEIPDWQGKGLSVMEMSHRSKEFVEIAETAKQDFIDLLEINKFQWFSDFLVRVSTPEGGARAVGLLGPWARAYVGFQLW